MVVCVVTTNSTHQSTPTAQQSPRNSGHVHKVLKNAKLATSLVAWCAQPCAPASTEGRYVLGMSAAASARYMCCALSGPKGAHPKG